MACLVALAAVVSNGFLIDAFAAEPDRKSFEWALVEDASPLANGMMLVSYGDREGGMITHVTFHRVLRVLPGVEPDLSPEEASRLAVLITDGTLGPLTYIIFKEPLYYGSDLDELGLPRRLWQDSEEDGVNGNEQVVSRVELAYEDLP